MKKTFLLSLVVLFLLPVFTLAQTCYGLKPAAHNEVNTKKIQPVMKRQKVCIGEANVKSLKNGW